MEKDNMEEQDQDQIQIERNELKKKLSSRFDNAETLTLLYDEYSKYRNFPEDVVATEHDSYNNWRISRNIRSNNKEKKNLYCELYLYSPMIHPCTVFFIEGFEWNPNTWNRIDSFYFQMRMNSYVSCEEEEERNVKRLRESPSDSDVETEDEADAEADVKMNTNKRVGYLQFTFSNNNNNNKSIKALVSKHYLEEEGDPCPLVPEEKGFCKVIDWKGMAGEIGSKSNKIEPIGIVNFVHNYLNGYYNIDKVANVSLFD